MKIRNLRGPRVTGEKAPRMGRLSRFTAKRTRTMMQNHKRVVKLTRRQQSSSIRSSRT